MEKRVRHFFVTRRGRVRRFDFNDFFRFFDVHMTCI